MKVEDGSEVPVSSTLFSRSSATALLEGTPATIPEADLTCGLSADLCLDKLTAGDLASGSSLCDSLRMLHSRGALDECLSLSSSPSSGYGLSTRSPGPVEPTPTPPPSAAGSSGPYSTGPHANGPATSTAASPPAAVAPGQVDSMLMGNMFSLNDVFNSVPVEHTTKEVKAVTDPSLDQAIPNIYNMYTGGNNTTDQATPMAWQWPASGASSGTAPGAHSAQNASTWGGLWGTTKPSRFSGPATVASTTTSNNGSSSSSHHLSARATAYLPQEHLLPSQLLFSSPSHGSAPLTNTPAGWAGQPPAASPSRTSTATGRNSPPAAAAAAKEPAGVVDGRIRAGGAVAAEPAGDDSLSAVGVEMLSTALEKLRPEELQLLSDMDPSAFQQLMVAAVTQLTSPQQVEQPPSSMTSPGHAGSPGLITPGAAAAASSLSQLHSALASLQGLQLTSPNNHGSSSSRAQMNLKPTQLQLPPLPPQQQAPMTLDQLQALLQAFPPTGQEQHASTPLPMMPQQRDGLLGAGYRLPSPGLPFHLGMPVTAGGGVGASSPGQGRLTAGATVGEGAWEDLTQNVRDKVHSMVMRCDPHIKLSHFDGGVRHWLCQLTSLFGESAALAGLHNIEGATNLAGVRNMRAFITTRLIDTFEQHIFSRDPAGYAARRLLPEQFQLLDELVSSGQGLQWNHFDPKVLDTIRDLGSLDYTRARLSRLSARELASVQNVPAYIFTLLSKRGKTAKQAAAAKGASEAALAAVLDAALAPTHHQYGTHSPPATGQALQPHHALSALNGVHVTPMSDVNHMQRSWTLGGPLSASTGFNGYNPSSMLSDTAFGASPYMPRPQVPMPTRSMSMQYDALSGNANAGNNLQQRYNLAAAQLAAAQLAMQHQQQQQHNGPHWG